jgi:hypothetical protein
MKVKWKDEVLAKKSGFKNVTFEKEEKLWGQDQKDRAMTGLVEIIP